ncbi:MAG TPA: choice-of-anchor Q domain-containing protein [Solirubrobacteraceae bacterium]
MPRTVIRAARPAVAAALAAALAALAAPATAPAAQRFASAGSADTLGTCSALAPCRIDWAITGAAAADEVVIEPGEYAISPIATSTPLTVHGVAGQARPRLLSNSDTAALTLRGETTLRHVLISAAGSQQDALTLQGGTGDDVVLVSKSGDGAKLAGSPDGTILRDSVARALGGDGRALVLKDGTTPSGPVDVINVTAVGDGDGADGVVSQVTRGEARLRNVVARGDSHDLQASANGAPLTVEYSNFRPSASFGYKDGPGNQSADPRFADAADGDYRPLAESPTIDAGATGALLGDADPDGNPRALGAAPDIGAFEWTGSSPLGRASNALAGGSDGTDPAPAPDAAADEAGDGARATPAREQPIAGKSVGLAPASGNVRVREPGSGAYVTLRAGDAVPLGTTIDARQGAVRLVSVRDAAGTLQAGVFSKGVFRVSQLGGRTPLTVVTLVGGDFGRCRGASASASGARVARAAGHSDRDRVVRQLWGRDRGGRFRADGRYAAGTLRGTVWVTQDRCDGTLTRVVEGAVSVYDKRRHRRVLVRRGHSYLARAAR